MYPTFSPAYNCCPSPSPPPHPSSASGRSLAWSPGTLQKLLQPMLLKNIYLRPRKGKYFSFFRNYHNRVLFFRNSWKRFEAKKRKVLLHVLECKAWLKRARSQNGFWHRHNCSIAKKLLDSKTSAIRREKKTSLFGLRTTNIYRLFLVESIFTDRIYFLSNFSHRNQVIARD